MCKRPKLICLYDNPAYRAFTLSQRRICRRSASIKRYDFLGAADNVVHGPDPVLLRASLPVLGRALGIGHLFYDKPIAVLVLLVQVGKIGVQFARQNKVVE